MGGRVFVIGLGLIGGSLALAIKDGHPDVLVSGYDRDSGNMDLAGLLQIIDRPVHSLEEGVREADLILIAVPVAETEKILERISRLPLKPGAIITDAGSTKGTILEAARCLHGTGAVFIGGHPMAGSHKTGPSAARVHLFENAFYLLVPGEGTDGQHVAALEKWLKETKANFLVTDAASHDMLTGVISHFPHIVASGLVNQAAGFSRDHPLVSRLAAGGFRDITRVASSSPEMWRDILLKNKQVLLKLLAGWQEEMDHIKALVAAEDGDGIYRFFEGAKQFRDALPVKGKGAIPSFYDLYVDIPDYPGIVSEITGYFADEKISLTNIRILETREEIYGVLVISFQTEEDRERAAACIASHTDYETFLA